MSWKYLILLLDIDVEDVVVSRYCNVVVATLGYKLLSPDSCSRPSQWSVAPSFYMLGYRRLDTYKNIFDNIGGHCVQVTVLVWTMGRCGHVSECCAQPSPGWVKTGEFRIPYCRHPGPWSLGRPLCHHHLPPPHSHPRHSARNWMKFLERSQCECCYHHCSVFRTEQNFSQNLSTSG